jgi:hypothetical protein
VEANIHAMREMHLPSAMGSALAHIKEHATGGQRQASVSAMRDSLLKASAMSFTCELAGGAAVNCCCRLMLLSADTGVELLSAWVLSAGREGL